MPSVDDAVWTVLAATLAVLWIWAVTRWYRSPDRSVRSLLWFVALLALPFATPLVYLLTQPVMRGPRAAGR